MRRPKGTLRGQSAPSKPKQLQVIPHLVKGRSPCYGCPLDERVKVPPEKPDRILLAAVGLGPVGPEVKALRPFMGEGGRLLRETLEENGLDAGVLFANMTRCRPDGDNFNSAQWKDAATHCWNFLVPDLEGSYPLLLLGSDPLTAFLQNKDARVSRMRGLWHQTPDGRAAFSTWAPAAVVRELHAGGGTRKLRQFQQDIKRMADKVLGREQFPELKVDIYKSPEEASEFLSKLAQYKKPWAFDIETYDAGQFPSRKSVGVDPFHPDFRVRGVAIAWRPNRGAWVELAPWESRREGDALKLLSRAFESGADKWAFNGNFDEAGLVYTGWIRRINRRVGDGMLSLIAANAGGQVGFALERAVVEILDEPQYWGVDKSKMEKLPIQKVADAAVRDACSTLKLTHKMHQRLRASNYIYPPKGEDGFYG